MTPMMGHSLRWTMGAALALALAGGGAQAQDKNGCDGFKWSIARERGWFAGDRKPAASGAMIAVGEAYAVALQPFAAVAFAKPPERASKPGTFAAVLNLAALDKAGAYQITLSDEAWIDVVQAGASVRSSGFSGQKDCPGVRKSVRFDLAAGPLTVQISNAAAQSLNLAIAPAE